MITVPAMRLHQFGVYFYQAILSVARCPKARPLRGLELQRGQPYPWQAPTQDAACRQDQLGRARAEDRQERGGLSAPGDQKKIAELMDYTCSAPRRRICRQSRGRSCSHAIAGSISSPSAPTASWACCSCLG